MGILDEKKSNGVDSQSRFVQCLHSAVVRIRTFLYKAPYKYLRRHKCCPAEFAAVRNGPARLCDKGSTSPRTWGDLSGVVLQAMTMQWVLWRAGSDPKIPNTAPGLSAAPLALSSYLLEFYQLLK